MLFVHLRTNVQKSLSIQPAMISYLIKLLHAMKNTRGSKVYNINRMKLNWICTREIWRRYHKLGRSGEKLGFEKDCSSSWHLFCNLGSIIICELCWLEWQTWWGILPNHCSRASHVDRSRVIVQATRSTKRSGWGKRGFSGDSP